MEVNMSLENPEIVKKIKNMNTGYKIKISVKQLKDGTHSLYLDLTQNNRRQKKSMGLYLIGTKQSKIRDENILLKAKLLRDKKETEIYTNNSGIKLASENDEINFLEFFKKFADSKPDYNYTVSYNNFTVFWQKSVLPISQLSREVCFKFRDYLLEQEFSANTANHYFKAFKATINETIQHDYLQKNPTNGIKITFQQKKIMSLSIDEVYKLINTPCKNPQLKQAFLFSVFSGLRRSDLNDLKFSDIVNNHIHKVLVKTKNIEIKFRLGKKALDIIDEQRKIKTGNRVFVVQTGGRLSRQLKEWLRAADVNEEITFHCARHTFGTFLAARNENPFVIKSKMGHSSLKTTEKYIHLKGEYTEEEIEQINDLLD